MNKLIELFIILIVSYYVFKVVGKLLVFVIQRSHKIIFRKRIQEMEQQVKKNKLFLMKLQEECNRD